MRRPTTQCYLPTKSMDAGDIHERLGFASKRMRELLVLNGGNLVNADRHERQQLVQEFFFHLVGAIEMVAQFANESRGLGIDVEVVSVPKVASRLPVGSPLRQALRALYVWTREEPFPSNPYDDDGYLYRIWNYRHQVTHRGRQPFQFNVGIGTAIDFGSGLRGRWREYRHRRTPDPATLAPPSTACFILDPREPPGVRAASTRTIPDELGRMLDIVSKRCEAALALI